MAGEKATISNNFHSYFEEIDMLVKLWKIVNFKISCQPEFAICTLSVSAHWEYVFEDIVDSITQWSFYENPWEKFLSGLRTRKSWTSPEQLVCFYFMDTENLCFPLCFGHEEAQNRSCGPTIRNWTGFCGMHLWTDFTC